MRGRSRFSATRSRPTTSRPQARSSATALLGATCRSTASPPPEFNSYGARRGNHEVLLRGTFANIRLRNQLAAQARGALPEGGYTYHLPDGEQLSIYDAAMRYAA